MGRTGPIAFFVAVALALAAVATGSDALISTHAAKQEAVVARVARMLDIAPWALTSQSLTGIVETHTFKSASLGRTKFIGFRAAARRYGGRSG